ncbi:flagellar export protein FliJ [Fodinicurvata sp. EGI_FJ10296]|uniref:flagellar export protein FliJ n=1 Tax=Fodinicurvata sp. EGI_FJ10296 TaxID=3231908 RepID=UPI003456AA57
MSSLDTLIRLHRWQLDEKRRSVAELETLVQSLQDQIDRLDEEIVAERGAAEIRDNPAATMTFGAYLKATDLRRETLKASMKHAKQKLSAAQDEINEAFQTVKRFEVVRDDRASTATLRNRRIEGAALDEIAVSAHERKKRGKDSFNEV